MCPFSLLMRFWMVLTVLLVLCQFVLSQVQTKWNITCEPESPTVYVDGTTTVNCNITGAEDSSLYVLQVKSQDSGLLNADEEVELVTNPYDAFSVAQFNMTGVFLGRTKVGLKIKKQNIVQHEETMNVRIIRKKRVIDTIFTSSVATLVALIYINFGCALNWQELKTSLRRPVGPVIAFIAQFAFMPLMSFGLGKLLFPDSTDMQLGMFFTGVAPGGGASNMWAVILGGNLHLSITMTTISTLAAFAMMPFWLFTLGRQIFDQTDIPVPYEQISTYAIALIVPLLIGFLIQRYLKKTATFLARILKGFSGLLLIFIIVFAIVTNLYLFQLFSWQIIISGLGLPWLGYVVAWIFAKICKQSMKDALTIAIEVGIQNTGISIFLLKMALPQPEADLTTIAPVAVATMTPIPLLLLFICQKIKERCSPTPTEKEMFVNQLDSHEERCLKDEPNGLIEKY